MVAGENRRVDRRPSVSVTVTNWVRRTFAEEEQMVEQKMLLPRASCVIHACQAGGGLLGECYCTVAAAPEDPELASPAMVLWSLNSSLKTFYMCLSGPVVRTFPTRRAAVRQLRLEERVVCQEPLTARRRYHQCELPMRVPNGCRTGPTVLADFGYARRTDG
jgi:hypothetical protein